MVSYKERIKHLTEMHKVINKKIDDMEKNHPHVEETKLMEMKKQRLSIKDEVSRLTKLQWEQDHEHVDLGE